MLPRQNIAGPERELQAGMHVLFVDDDALLRKTYGIVLEKAGYDVTTAQDGRDAVAHLRTTRFDVVVLDVYMPVQEGIETLIAVKRTPHPPRVIVISGGSRAQNADFLDAAEKLGADYTLRKPFLPKQLLALIECCRVKPAFTDCDRPASPG